MSKDPNYQLGISKYLIDFEKNAIYIIFSDKYQLNEEFLYLELP